MTKTAVTPEQAKAAMRVIIAVGEMIQDAGEIPSGHLYAMLMPTNMTLESYHRIITLLKKCKVVTEENFLLTWVGPPKEPEGIDPLPKWVIGKGEGQ
jgi:hypothetical protein